MTTSEALAKAADKAQRWHRDYLVISTSTHPYITGEHVYVIAKADKALWKSDEQLIAEVAAT